ncbi:hypothetical protein [uncultured Chryseobacterium sp.]|uniref:hypothetical protein n=1 Tax=uncultured Chryseobacterium sp. TaxID=259322 RepID=UPI0025F57A6F|nr:hypothetical protein [uncultured Chryseobacterium sp.]
MNKIVPHKVDYDLTNKITRFQFILIIVGTVLSLISIFKLEDSIKNIIDTIVCIISIIYFVLEFTFSYFFIKAEQKRIDDLIDNSLNSQLSDEKSENYYTNEEIKKSITKLGVNSFENTFFSKNIVERMIKKQLIIFLIVTSIYLISIFVIEKKILVVLFQLLLPLYIVKDFVILLLLKSRLDKIFDCYKKIFTSTKKGDREPLIINNIISYEKLISAYGVQLDSLIFDKMNDDLSQKWIDLKKRYKIE